MVPGLVETGLLFQVAHQGSARRCIWLPPRVAWRFICLRSQRVPVVSPRRLPTCTPRQQHRFSGCCDPRVQDAVAVVAWASRPCPVLPAVVCRPLLPRINHPPRIGGDPRTGGIPMHRDYNCDAAPRDPYARLAPHRAGRRPDARPNPLQLQSQKLERTAPVHAPAVYGARTWSAGRWPASDGRGHTGQKWFGVRDALRK
jgi:hypothetical protein